MGQRSSDSGPVFIDEARIHVSGGRGGNGCCSFRREKFVPRGGPDGGCGGSGGDVVLEAAATRNTLYYFQRHRHFKAKSGAHGQGANKTGACGAGLVLKVPPGTVVRSDDGRVLADLVNVGERCVVARGGRGGRGNRVFATSRRQAPKFAEKGEPGQELWVRLELRLIAEVGLIGYPNAGKSTLLSRVSAAHPKIADYPFTTLAPKLGVVSIDDERTFTMADLPGLIEGASEGRGLGARFLRHAERTRLLLHLVDVSGWDQRDPAQAYRAIRRELEQHHPRLAEKPELLVANKLDVPGAPEMLEILCHELDMEIMGISAVTGLGMDELLLRLSERLDNLPKFVPRVEMPVGLHRPEPTFSVEKEDDRFVVRGRTVERLVAMTDLENEEALRRMERLLSRMGVYRILEQEGCREGDTVIIASLEFEYVPDIPSSLGD